MCWGLLVRENQCLDHAPCIPGRPALERQFAGFLRPILEVEGFANRHALIGWLRLLVHIERVLGQLSQGKTSVKKTLGNQCSDGNQNQANPSNSLDIKWYQYRCSNHAQLRHG